MARKIDETKPLSAASRQWLTDWGKFDVIERIDAEHGKDKDSLPTVDVKADLVAILAKHGIDAGDDALAAVDAALDDKDAPASAEDADVPFADEPEGGSADGYGDWTNAQLREELGRRELSKSGNQDELVARLEEDDDE